MPFHTEQLRLSGMTEEEIMEAAAAVQVTIGVSAYLHGIGYSLDKFLEEIRAPVEHGKGKVEVAPCE